MLSVKQQRLVDFALKNDGAIQTSQANNLLQHCFYANHKKYVGLILKRLVAKGILTRQKPGHYTINLQAKAIQKPAASAIQPSLF